jgi:hypothetical protein
LKEEKKMPMLNLTTESSSKEPQQQQQQQSSEECYLSNVVENGLDELVTLIREITSSLNFLFIAFLIFF